MLDLIYLFCIYCECLLFINEDRFLVVIVVYSTKSYDIYTQQLVSCFCISLVVSLEQWAFLFFALHPLAGFLWVVSLFIYCECELVFAP